MNSLLITTIACTNLFLAGGLLAQPAMDWARMQRDLDIMEMVLERLLNDHSASMLRLGGTVARGVYLPEFGVLFQVPQVSSSFSYFEFHTEDHDAGAAERGAKAFAGAPPSASHMEDSNAAFEAELLEFFGRYADAIGQLRPEDRIAVYRSAGPEVSIFFNFPGVESKSISSSNREVLAWVRKSDLDAAQSGKLSPEELKNRVNFRGEQHGPAATRIDQKEIDILAGIIEVALGLPRGTAEGLSIDNYGAVLFTRADFEASFPRRIWSWSAESPTESQNASSGEGSDLPMPKTIEGYLRASERASRERAQNWQGEYQKFKERLMSAVADYGHSLRYLRSEDRLVVVADLSNAPEKQPRQLVCAVKKQQVEQYHFHRISQEQLRKAMVLYEN